MVQESLVYLSSNLDQEKCLFCHKDSPRTFIRNRVKVWEHLHVITNGLDNVISHAKSKEDNDLLQRLELYGNKIDQIKLHRTCRTEYMQKPESWRSRSKEEKESQSELEEAHLDAFQNVCKVIEKSIIEEHNVMKLTDLREIYIQSLNNSNFPNEDYRGEKLKHKIEKHPLFSKHVSFLRLDNNSQYHSLLIYNANTSIAQALGKAYILGGKDTHKEVALNLRKAVFQKYKESDKLPWPPSDDFLNSADCIPFELKSFLNQLLSGKTTNTSENVT